MTTLHIRGYMQDVYEFLNNKAYTLNGVHGYFVYNTQLNRRDNRMIHSLYHKPSIQGMKSEAYKARKAQYGDDFDTSFDQDDMTPHNVAMELCFQFSKE